MWNRILISVALATESIRTHFLHTVLSVLGIVIGVAALVSILSFIDGMEKFANEEIGRSTTLKAIMIQSNPYRTVNKIQVKNDSFPSLNYEEFMQLHASLHYSSEPHMYFHMPSEFRLIDPEISSAAELVGMLSNFKNDPVLVRGAIFSKQDVSQKNPIALINTMLAAHLQNKINGEIIDRKILIQGKTVQIKGIVKDKEEFQSRIYVPVTLFTSGELKANPPQYIIEAANVEEVMPLKAEIEQWLQAKFKNGNGDFNIIVNSSRLERLSKQFLLFRIIMGLIVGISVLVGGIGIMNVLLISVKERTTEIGIRKATGAKRRDILLQFLLESIVISGFGCLLGLLLGIAGTAIAVPIIKSFTQMPFEAVYTVRTMLLISAVALITGIVFGTYPAVRASRLDPVEAMRRE